MNAVVVAVVSAAISLTTLIWQLFLYRLSGARILVEIRPVVIGGIGSMIMGPPKKWTSPPPFGDKAAGLSVDLVRIRVINVGRGPVTVSNIAIDRGRSARWRRIRSTVRPSPLGNSVIADAVTDEAVRLEQGAFASVYYDIWPIVEDLRQRGQLNIKLRASADLAGRHPRLSPRNKTIVIDREQQSIRAYRSMSALDRAYQAMWRALVREGGDHVAKLSEAWYLIKDPLKRGDDLESIQEVLKKSLKNTSVHYLSLVAHEAYHNAYRSLASIGQAQQR